MVRKRNLKKWLGKLLTERSSREFAEALLASVPWDRLMLDLANICFAKGQAAQGKPQKRAWTGKARLFHRAMDEALMTRKKAHIFKVTHRDVYECRCKRRFGVDPTTEKNIRWDLGQCEIVVTCPDCGRQENLKDVKKQPVYKAEPPQ